MMRMTNTFASMGMLLCLILLAACSVQVDEKLKDPDFLAWLSDKTESEIGKLRINGNFSYRHSNIKEYERYYDEWRTVVESYVPKEAYKDPDFLVWLSAKNENELGKLKRDGNFYYAYFNDRQWQGFYEEWDRLEEPFLIEETLYSRFGVEDEKILKNSKGPIAVKVFLRSPYNYTQVTGIGYQYPNEKEALFYLIDYQRQRRESLTTSHTEKFLCLDKKGRIIYEGNIRPNGRPLFIEKFKAKQKTTFENEYQGSFIIRTKTKMYPCEDCDSLYKGVRFVW